jgi:hypothetical protein
MVFVFLNTVCPQCQPMTRLGFQAVRDRSINVHIPRSDRDRRIVASQGAYPICLLYRCCPSDYGVKSSKQYAAYLFFLDR